MSQVIRKFENSGKIEQSKPELFERSGVGKYNKADLVAGLYRNIDTYIKNNNLSGDKAVSFRDSANQFIKGIENGTISMNGDGTFSDATGSMASTGKFDKNWAGRKKDTTNNAFNLVGDYALDYINQMQQYTEPAAKPKSKFNTNDFLTKEISKRWYGGNNIDFGNWFKNRGERDRNALLGDIFNNADYNQLYQDYDWTNTGINSAEDLATRGKAFSTAISNNTLDNDDYNTFAALGGSGLDKFLKEASVETEFTSEQDKMKAWEAEARTAGATTPEAVAAFVRGKRQDEENTNRAIIERQAERDRKVERDTFFNDYTARNPFRETIQSGYVPGSVSYKPEDFDKPIKDFYNNNIDQYLNDNLSRDWFRAGNTQHIANHNNYQQQRAQEKKTKEEEEVKQKAESKGRTVEEQQTADRKPGSITSGDWTSEDYTRLASIVADIGSIGAAYVPVYGTAVSAGLGLGSSLANYGADLSENGFKWGDLGNLAINLGLDTVGLVPGLGSAAKGSKVLKTAAKYLPRVLATASLANAPEVYQSVKKAMTPGTDLTVDDWRNIAEGFKMVLQGGKGIKRTIQAHNLKKDLATGNKVLTTLGGKEVSVTPAQLSEIRSHRKIEDQEAALQLLLKDDNLRLAEDLNKRWFNPSRYLPNSNIRDEYDFNKTVKKRTSQGIIEVPRVYSNSDKYIAATMQQDFVKIPGVDELTIKYNDWKYGVNKGGKKSTKKQESPKPKKELLALPAPNQVHRTPSREYINVDISRDLGRSNLTGKGVITSSSPVESPDAGTIRTVNAVSSILQPFTNRPKNLPAVIPASRNAKKVVASQTIQPTQRLDQFIEGQIPGERQFGRQRAKTEREYRDVFHPAAEREYNQVWDEAVRGKKDFGYEEVFPKRSPYAPPTPTEVYVTPGETVKDSNARYLWELINKKPSTAHVKRDNPPRKAKPKKKKTSRDDRVTKKAEGGIVQFLQGGNTVGRIKAKDMSNWNRANALANYDFGADVDRWKSGYTGSDDWRDAYMAAFNGGEDIYDQLTSKTGDYFGGKYNYSVQDPLAKHRQITFRGTNQGFDDLIRKGIVGYGTTEGNSGFDIYAGDRTGNRTLARGMSPEDVARFNKQLATRGMELYDKGNGAYRLRRLEQKPVELPEAVVTADTPKTPATTNPSAIKGAAPKKGKGFNLGVMPEDVIALGRMVGGLAANNRAAKLYKEGLKPTLLDTFENTVPLQGNFQAATNAEQQAGNLESVAARPRTSDASLQLAGELEASGRAGQARFQGGLQDAEMFYKTRMLGQQESDAAKARRVDVANRNRASMNQIDAAKKQIDAARVTSNYQNVIAPYLAGVENQFAQKRAMNQQLDMEEAQRGLDRTFRPRFQSLQDEERAAKEAYIKNNNNSSVGWETSDASRALRDKATALNDEMFTQHLQRRRQIMGSPFMFTRRQNIEVPTPYTMVKSSKSGGKLSAADREKLQRAKDFNKRLLEDNKQFHKDIMESKREHNKLIMSMSSLTSELIKKAMS